MAGKVLVRLHAVEADIGKDFSHLLGLIRANFNNDKPWRQQVITGAHCNCAIAIQSVHPAIQRAGWVPLPDLCI